MSNELLALLVCGVVGMGVTSCVDISNFVDIPTLFNGDDWRWCRIEVEIRGTINVRKITMCITNNGNFYTDVSAPISIGAITLSSYILRCG